MKNDTTTKNLQDSIRESMQRAKDILDTRQKGLDEALKAKEQLDAEIEKLKPRKTFTAETGNRDLYDDLCKEIREKEEALEFFAIRAAAIKKSADPESGKKEFADLEKAWKGYERKKLEEILQLADNLQEKLNELNATGQEADQAVIYWSQVAGQGYQIQHYPLAWLFNTLRGEGYRQLRLNMEK